MPHDPEPTGARVPATRRPFFRVRATADGFVVLGPDEARITETFATREEAIAAAESRAGAVGVVLVEGSEPGHVEREIIHHG